MSGDISADPVGSSIRSLKEIITLVFALTVANSLHLLLGEVARENSSTITDVPAISWCLMILMMANVLRFYHGNVRHLDRAYLSDGLNVQHGDLKSSTSGLLGLDFICVFSQSVLFAAMSFYINRSYSFVGIFFVLLCIDLAWMIVSLIFENVPARDRKRVLSWLINNGIVALILGIVVFARPIADRNWADFTMVALIMANTVVDFCVNWRFYFPARTQTTVADEGK